MAREPQGGLGVMEASSSRYVPPPATRTTSSVCETTCRGYAAAVVMCACLVRGVGIQGMGNGGTMDCLRYPGGLRAHSTFHEPSEDMPRVHSAYNQGGDVLTVLREGSRRSIQLPTWALRQLATKGPGGLNLREGSSNPSCTTGHAGAKARRAVANYRQDGQ